MQAQLLKTSYRVPPLPYRVLHRERLVDALEYEVPHYKLIHITAPAGYGKTTLLTQWAHSSAFQIAWLSISPEYDEPRRFLRGLLKGWQEIQPDNGPFRLDLLLGSNLPDINDIVPVFLNAAADQPDHTVFVLDDYHLIQDQAIHDILTYLLDHLPPTLHVILAGRSEPPLPLARYRARNEMLELHAEDLQFSLSETVSFINGLRDLDLSVGQITALNDQAKGWATGLHLAALALNHDQHRDLKSSPELIGGKQRFVADFLGEEVLAGQSDEVQQFLLQTSLLDRLSASLSDAVTGKQNGREMLAYLERENLFLAPFDENRVWFQYHPLFAGFLQEELQRRFADVVADLHKRAAQWYFAHDLPDMAFRHAVAAGDKELTIRIAERYSVAKLMGGEIKDVQQWLALIPDTWMAIYPAFGLIGAGLLMVTGQFEASARRLDQVEKQAQEMGEDGQGGHYSLAKVTAMRCNIACFQNDMRRAEMLADKALHELPADDANFRPGVFGALGDTYRRNNRWQAAEESYLQLLAYTDSPSFRLQAVHLYGALADLNLRQGRLKQAAGFWQKALAAIQNPDNWGIYPLPLIGWVHIRLGELYYEWNDIDQAWEHVTYGLDCTELSGDVRGLIAGNLLAGRIKLTKGDLEEAKACLEQARPLIEGAQFAHWNSRFERLQLELWLAHDMLRTASDWSDAMLSDPTIDARPESDIAMLASARVLIVKRDESSLEQALATLDRLIRSSEVAGRIAVTIEALALQAMARWQHNDPVAALISLEHALRLAKPEGFLRLFVDLGFTMARVLQEAQSRNVMPGTVARILAAFGATEPAQAAIPEPLTDREQEVLELIAAGLTNREVAERLVIAPGTVKKHTAHIYGKLGVNNRTQAVAKARQLDLLEQNS